MLYRLKTNKNIHMIKFEKVDYCRILAPSNEEIPRHLIRSLYIGSLYHYSARDLKNVEDTQLKDKQEKKLIKEVPGYNIDTHKSIIDMFFKKVNVSQQKIYKKSILCELK